MEDAFNNYNNGPHSSIGYLTHVEFEKQWNCSKEFKDRFMLRKGKRMKGD